MRSALEFFATAQMFIIHIFNSVHPFSVVVTASVIHGILASGCLSAAAVSLMFQGVEVTIGAESGNLVRQRCRRTAQRKTSTGTAAPL